MLKRSELHELISTIFFLLSIITLFIAVWIWLWNINLAISFGATGALSALFAVIYYISAISLKIQGR